MPTCACKLLPASGRVPNKLPASEQAASVALYICIELRCLLLLCCTQVTTHYPTTAQVLRTYWGDAARLADVARQTLVFDGIRDLARCLAVVAEDPEVRAGYYLG